MGYGLGTQILLVIVAALVGETIRFALVMIRKAIRGFLDRPIPRLLIRKLKVVPGGSEAESVWPNDGLGVWDRELDG